MPLLDAALKKKVRLLDYEPRQGLGFAVWGLGFRVLGSFQGKIDGDAKVTEQQSDLRPGSPKAIAPAILRTIFEFAVLDRWPSNVRVHVAWVLSFVEG